MMDATAICGSFNSTFKISNKATISDKDCQRSKYLKGGILSIINESNQIIAWHFCQSKSNAEVQELLAGLKVRTQMLGRPLPEMFVSDNCCMVRSTITTVFPDSDSIQDVWHFIARYTATILNGNRNIHRMAVVSDITSAILKSHASEEGHGAKYWSKEEQELQLVAAYDKWAEKGTIWSAASEKVHQEQLRHVRKGCLQRRRQDILSDGSRIEGCHKAWNSLQRAQPSGIVMLAALSHDFVHRRNIRIAFNHDSGSKKTPFIALTVGCHHTDMVGSITELYNQLRTVDLQSTLVALPELHSARSDEMFGLVPSKHIATFGGLVKEEVVEFKLEVISAQGELGSQGDTEQALLSSREFIFNELNIDPKLLQLPQVSARSQIASSTSTAVVLTAPPDQADSACLNPTDPRHVTANGPNCHTRKIDSYFAPGNSHRTPHSSRPTMSKSEASVSPPSKSNHHALQSNHPVSQSGSDSLSSESESARQVDVSQPDGPTLSPGSGPTRSEHLFLAATGIHPDSLVIKGDVEFYLFMDMRKEFHWISYEMTSRKWVNATEEYNRRLIESCGLNAVKKNPIALLRKLGDVEPTIIQRSLKNNFKSKRNKESFWREHCAAINLVKADPRTGKKPRKVPTCSRCKSVMYPGPERSAENHRRGICADGIRSKPASEFPDAEVPPWPQPHGIFSDGLNFHTEVFLRAVKQIYEMQVAGASSSMPFIDAHAFLLMLTARTVILKDADGHPVTALFRLYPGYKVDSSVPTDRIVQHNGGPCLRINYLEQDA